MTSTLTSNTTASSLRFLIVNADDFGLSEGVNAGVIQAFERGIVRSTSAMVRCPAISHAVDLARRHPGLGVGLHIDIGEWQLESGEWVPLYTRASATDYGALEHEAREQVEVFSRLFGRAPTHIDSHQHVHTREPLRHIASRIAHELAVPLRHVTNHSRYLGDFYGQDSDGSALADRMTPAFLRELITALPVGTTELCCHPAAYVDFGGMYRHERLTELELLCDPAIGTFLEERSVRLTNFVGLVNSTGVS